ncbi:Biotin carboxylase [Pseudobutyrivibrio sp. 49]|uniref:ATP-grasp domain-containing protein n=1 Tax=Pseudobutyrivibrio sp. 49 TaxID=1855344 RepID=UPI0008821591|nr:ATP-grasp domain-containing protein [Pseudobutyrivibrio sp. 49]SDH61898.1 Biotin carboxylase [Pseudobutyrivibrio sp. 49]
MKKLAIIGASYLQVPLINKAKDLGYETHVFAWAAGDVGETLADYFYPISIVEKEQILEKCQEIGIDGICTIASDLATVPVNYVAHHMGLAGNSLECTEKSTNKWAMRAAFEANGDPSPKCVKVQNKEDYQGVDFQYPVIIKPLDRSGSRGITRVDNPAELDAAIEAAKEVGFEKAALIEEFATGIEYSIECVSYKGEHTLLAITRKYTTGAPHFIETAHSEPASLTPEMAEKVKNTVFHALDSLEIKNSASHSELKIDKDGNIRIIEIGGRMGGDCIGSSLVELSTGVDFVKAVIDIALGQKPEVTPTKRGYAIIRYVFSQEDKDIMDAAMSEMPEAVIEHEIMDSLEGEITDSSTRYGYFIMSDMTGDIRKYLPSEI